MAQLKAGSTVGGVPIATTNDIDSIWELIYPVGAIYISVNNTSPATLFGGTWVAWGTGRVPVGVDTSDTDFNTVEKTGGAKTHTLNINQIPSHEHPVDDRRTDVGDWHVYSRWNGEAGGTGKLKTQLSECGSPYSVYKGLYATAIGGGQAHNNLQPYITCYMWKRTA